MGWVYAVDSSYDLLTEDEARKLKDAGVALYIQALSALPASGLEQPPYRVQSLRNAYNVGLPIAAYSLLGPGNPIHYMDFARSGVPDDLWDALLFNAVDVEVGGISGADVVLALANVSSLLGGTRPRVVYTSVSRWAAIGSPYLTPVPWLWEASWTGDPARLITHLPFGPWTMANLVGIQWSGGTLLPEGQFADRNQFNADVLFPPLPPSTPNPTPPKPTADDIQASLRVVAWASSQL